MSDQIEDIVDNLKQSSVWVRILLMIGFAFVLYMVILPAIILLTIAQALFVALSGDANRNLRGLGSLIEQYVGQIIAFVTYNSELRPFPFSDFPSEEIDDTEKKASKAGSVKNKASSDAEKKTKKPDAEKPVPESKATVKKAVKKKAPAKKVPKTTGEPKADGDAGSKGEGKTNSSE